jgi:hypothetical protein
LDYRHGKIGDPPFIPTAAEVNREIGERVGRLAAAAKREAELARTVSEREERERRQASQPPEVRARIAAGFAELKAELQAASAAGPRTAQRYRRLPTKLEAEALLEANLEAIRDGHRERVEISDELRAMLAGRPDGCGSHLDGLQTPQRQALEVMKEGGSYHW